MQQPRIYALMDELSDLKDKYARLQAFIQTPTFNGLETPEKSLLVQQSMGMWNYLCALQNRVDLYERRAG